MKLPSVLVYDLLFDVPDHPYPLPGAERDEHPPPRLREKVVELSKLQDLHAFCHKFVSHV